MKKIRVLIFPAGAENALEIYKSIKHNINLEVFGASSKSDHASFFYPKEKYFEGDFNISKDGFLEKFNKLIIENEIDIVIPTHDTVSLFLSENKSLLNAKILTSNVRTAKIAREKKLTYELFKNETFCPKIYEDETNLDFPVLIKPNRGEGAKGVYKIENFKQLQFYLSENIDMIIMEYLPGEEFTVDCFTKSNGELLFVGPRTRERINMGISFRSKSVELTEEIDFIAKKINDLVSIRGAWFFQIKKDQNGNFKLLEFSVRQAGTMALYRQLGVNFALLSIFDSMGFDVIINNNNNEIILDRCLYNRYKYNFDYEKVYIDYDDTLIIDNKVNSQLMQFIYQCINNKKKVILITKHAHNLKENMGQFRISDSIFDDIIHLNQSDIKSDYIDKEKAIFIDNYFAERYLVREKLGIPVFDVDAVESLLE